MRGGHQHQREFKYVRIGGQQCEAGGGRIQECHQCEDADGQCKEYINVKLEMEKYKKLIWINPYPKDTWGYTSSTGIVRDLLEDRMYPLTLSGLEEGMKFLSK